jgi:hypothetical protein
LPIGASRTLSCQVGDGVVQSWDPVIIGNFGVRDVWFDCKDYEMVAHGVMFHHFHDDRHRRGQGSISAEQLVELIEHLGRNDILPAQEWMRRAAVGALTDTDTCLTFDDALRCQYDVALPVLRDLD